MFRRWDHELALAGCSLTDAQSLSPITALFTINEFKTWSRFGRTQVYELINNGELRAIKIGCRTYIPVDAAKSWLEAQSVYRDAA